MNGVAAATVPATTAAHRDGSHDTDDAGRDRDQEQQGLQITRALGGELGGGHDEDQRQRRHCRRTPRPQHERHHRGDSDHILGGVPGR